MYLRSLAEMENVRTRARKEIETTKQFAIRKFAKDLLDTVDILTLALTSVPEEATSSNEHLKSLYTGVNMTNQELQKTLKRYGVEEIAAMNALFDPNLHQALYQIPVPEKEKVGTVIAVEKKGYTLYGSVLRPSQVGIGKDVA